MDTTMEDNTVAYDSLDEYEFTTFSLPDADNISDVESCLQSFNRTLPPGVWFPNKHPLEICKLCVNIFGIVGNLVLFIILRKKHLGSRMATLFFSIQCILDLVVCLMSAILIIQPAMWLIGDSDFGHILVCRGWHSLMLYLFFIQYSIINLVLIGLERYWAVVKPLMYQKLSIRRHGRICILAAMLYSLVFAIPNIWETKYRRVCGVGLCIGQEFTPGVHLMLKVYSVMWFVFIYALSLLMLIFLYGKIINKLRTSQVLARCAKKDQAAEQFTRMAIVVTIVYVLCITYDAFAYMLGRTELWQYNYNTIEHQMGMFVISLNSFANPYIYFFFVMRTSFLRIVQRRRRRRSSSGVSDNLLRSIGRSSTLRTSTLSPGIQVGGRLTFSEARTRLQTL